MFSQRGDFEYPKGGKKVPVKFDADALDNVFLDLGDLGEIEVVPEYKKKEGTRKVSEEGMKGKNSNSNSLF